MRVIIRIGRPFVHTTVPYCSNVALSGDDVLGDVPCTPLEDNAVCVGPNERYPLVKMPKVAAASLLMPPPATIPRRLSLATRKRHLRND